MGNNNEALIGTWKLLVINPSLSDNEPASAIAVGAEKRIYELFIPLAVTPAYSVHRPASPNF
jgi:hypothetical protein